MRPIFPDARTFIDALQQALASGQVTNNGRWVREFEQRLGEYLGAPTLAYCNGQLALMTMLRAAGIESGEVIVPSFTFAATPHAVAHIAFYLGNRSRALWQTKSGTQVSLTIGLEQLVLNSSELQAKQAEAKMIEHQPTEDRLDKPATR